MDEVDGGLDCCSLRDGPSIDLNGLLSKTCDTANKLHVKQQFCYFISQFMIALFAFSFV